MDSHRLTIWAYTNLLMPKTKLTTGVLDRLLKLIMRRERLRSTLMVGAIDMMTSNQIRRRKSLHLEATSEVTQANKKSLSNRVGG